MLSLVQNLRPVPLTGFEIQGFKLKKNDNNDNKKIREMDLCHISHVNGPIQTKF